MSDEIRAAAERLRSATMGGYPQMRNMEHLRDLMTADRRILADWAVQELAARAEKEAEEGKPVDEAWLRSIGFEKRDGWPLGIWRENIRWLRHQDGAEWITWGEKPLITKQPITRGQLLRLLEALGKEGA